MTLVMWKDNRLPLITDTITVTDPDTGVTAPVDLTGATVTFSMRVADSAVLKVSAGASTVVSDVDGTVSYAWAAADTDTVGAYKAWWTVTLSGLMQDTPEFDLEVAEHAPDSVDVPNPVGAGGATIIYQGDSYLNADGRALTYQLDVQDAPDLTGLTVTYRVAGELQKAMTVVGEDAVRVDLTSAETAAIAAGTHLMEIEATVSVGNVVTLVRSTVTVLPDIAAVA